MTRFSLALASILAALLALSGCSAGLSDGRAIGSALIVGYDASDVDALAAGERIELDLRASGVVYEIDGTLAPVVTAPFDVRDELGVVPLADWLADTGASTDVVTERLRVGSDAEALVSFAEPSSSEGDLGTSSEALAIGIGGGVGCPGPHGGYQCTDLGTCVCSGDFDCNRMFCEMDCPSGDGCTERGGILNCWCRIHSFRRATTQTR